MTDASSSTNQERLNLQVLMATAADLAKKLVGVGLLPGETIQAIGFVYKSLQFVVRSKGGSDALDGVEAFLSDRAPATLRVHRLLAAMQFAGRVPALRYPPVTVRERRRSCSGGTRSRRSRISISSTSRRKCRSRSRSRTRRTRRTRRPALTHDAIHNHLAGFLLVSPLHRPLDNRWRQR
jgi:hypothetical protein